MSRIKRTLDRCRLFYYQRCGLLFALMALALIVWTLFGGETIGLSNNGDFGRVMNASSLTFGEEYPSHTFVDTFVINLEGPSLLNNIGHILFSSEGLDTYPSVHVAVVRLSAALNLLKNWVTGSDLSMYRLGVLGVMYALVYAAGIGFLVSRFQLRRWWQDALLKCVFLLVLCDIGYTAYFNSFYGEALEHIALVWCAGMLIQVLSRQPTGWDALWCAFWAIIYGWSKFFNIPLAVLWLLVMEGAVFIRCGRKLALAWCAAGLAVLAAVWLVIPSWMDTATNYNAVFYGVTRDVDRDTAAEYLTDMGLPEDLADYRDTNYYIVGVQESLEASGLQRAAMSIGKPELLRFYLTHPRRLWEQAKLTALHCGMIRPYYLANLGNNAPSMTYSRKMTLWSRIRDRLLLDSLCGCLAVTAATIGIALSFSHRKKAWGAIVLSLALLGALSYAFLMPVILNGEGDLAKHMFAYGEMVDLALLGCLVAGLCSPHHQKLRIVRFGILASLVVVLMIPILSSTVADLWHTRRPHDCLEPGAYLNLGTYNRRPLSWVVLERTEEGLLLLCADEDILGSFDSSGNNAWAESSLRQWLNNTFLSNFSLNELALMQTKTHSVILPDRYRSLSETWEQTFACSHISVLADRLWEKSFMTSISDTVRLAGVDLVATLARKGWPITGKSWWLETPYCPSQGLVRYVGEDGHIYFGAAETQMRIRPVVEIKDSAILCGSGTRKNPFVLNIQA